MAAGEIRSSGVANGGVWGAVGACMTLDPNALHATYLRAYVEAVGGGRLEGTMALAETTEPERAAIALAVHHAKKDLAPASKVYLTKEVRAMLTDPGAPVGPVAPPTT